MRILLLLAPFLAPSARAAVEKTFPLHIELRRGGEIVCSQRREVTEGDEYFLCETKVQGNRAFAHVGARRVSRSQLQVTGTIEELTPSGRMNIATPSITVLSGEPASFSIGSASAPEGSLSMEVTAVFPDREVPRDGPQVLRLPATGRF